MILVSRIFIYTYFDRFAMSGAFIAKMLKNKRKTTPIKQRNISKFTCINSSAVEYKCRICLRKGCIPIYGGSFDFPEAIKTFGEIKIEESDSLPKHLCEECHSLLIGAVLFRKSAKESDRALRMKETLTDSPLSDANYFSSDTEKSEEIHMNVNECKTCGLKLKTSIQVSQHRNSKYHKKVLIQCKVCMKVLTQKQYSQHVLRHQTSSHLVCHVCGKLYRKDNLIRHLQLHSSQLPYQCPQCPYRGRFSEYLKVHERTHSGIKPFLCEKCDLRFLTKSNLKRHELTHDTDKPHKCHECSRGFHKQQDLDAHLKVEHAGIKEFSCQLCGNKYGMKKALMRHELKVHKRKKMAKGRLPLYLQTTCNT